MFKGLFGAVIAVGFSGCAVYHQGQLRGEVGERSRLYIQDGRELRLVTGPENAALLYVDGSMVEVWGRRFVGGLVVRDWKVISGPHGMATWVGTLERRGVQLGLMDRNSGVFYVFEDTSAATLREFVGRPVMVEGYVEGPHLVRVLDYRVLEKSAN
jgi:hypothetical protein